MTTKRFAELPRLIIFKRRSKMPESKEFIKLLDDIRDLHRRKNDGYAGKGSSDPWANFRMSEAIGVSAFKGCLVRMSDKFIRITNLAKDETNDQVGESIIDTLMDLSVYSLIAICLYNEQQELASQPEIEEKPTSGRYPWGSGKNSSLPIAKEKTAEEIAEDKRFGRYEPPGKS